MKQPSESVSGRRADRSVPAAGRTLANSTQISVIDALTLSDRTEL